MKRERLDARQKLHLYRLMKATGNLRDARDIMEYSDAATVLRLPMESLEVLELGLSRKVWKEDVDRARAERYQKSARTELAALQARLSTLEQEARVAPTGEQYVLLGMVLNAPGNNQQAIAALRAGIAKGGLKYPDHANMLLAEALLAAGQRAEANKVFRTIKSADAVTQRIVELWILFTSN